MTQSAGGGAEGGRDRTTLALMGLVREATVRIHRPEPGYVPDGSDTGFLGSGFFIAPSWVLTCAHVASQGEGGGVNVVFRPDRHSAAETAVAGTVVATLPETGPGTGPRAPGWPAPDLALIRLLEPAEHACVYVTERPAAMLPGSRVHYVGWTGPRGGRPAAVSGDCTVKGMFGGPADDGQQIRLGGDWMEAGMSGGPVVDLARGEVVGVLKSRIEGEQGGTAVGIERLRTLPVQAGAEDRRTDPYHAVFHAHDRHHADRHDSTAGTERTWVDAQSELASGPGRTLSPRQRIVLLGRLADIPPPVSTRALLDLLDGLPDVYSGDHRPAPRGWRDGLAALYEVRDGERALELVLRYCMAVISADRPYEAPDTADATQALWEWVRRTADDHLSRSFRKELDLLWSAGPGRPAPGRRTPPARPGAGPGAAGRSFVLLSLELRGWEQGRYDWRIAVGESDGDFRPVAEDAHGTALADLPSRLAASLAEAFRCCDEPDSPAVLQVATGRALLNLDVDKWCLTPYEPPLGVVRPVVLRCADQEPHDEEWSAKERKVRWNRTAAGPMRGEVADCVGGIRVRVPDTGELRTLAHETVPLLCQYGGHPPAEALAGLGRVMSAGYGVVLWRRRAGQAGAVCTEFHRRAADTVTQAGASDRLPYAIHELRKSVRAGRIETYWSDSVALLYDDPHHPLPGSGQLLEAP
ncbi:VMAP-C domain-containing protein [Streptomyces sp. NPDC004980]